MNENAEGIITEIERYSIHDGTGIRSAVFFKGCPLRCKWCCNPETQKFFPEPSFAKERCVACGRCVNACSHLERDSDGRPHFVRKMCGILCGTGHDEGFSCTKTCYYQAIRQIGERVTVRHVMREVMRDINFYDSTGGGVTFSGGEPFCQPNFLLALLNVAAKLYLNTAVETCGAGALEDYEKAMPFLDMLFLDVKSADSEKCLNWIGYTLDKLQNNIIEISCIAQRFNVPLFIRVPVIPGFNETKEDIRLVIDFIRSLPRTDGVELLPYHKLGSVK